MPRLKKRKTNRMNYSLKNDLIFLNNKDNQKPLLKVLIFFLIFFIVNFGNSGIGATNAYFNDTEESLNNSYQAKTLDFSLVDGGTSGVEIMLAGTVIRWLDVVNEGGVSFQYTVRADNLSGELCNFLVIKAILDGELKQEGALSNFHLDPSVVFSESLDKWQFDIELAEDYLGPESGSCSLNLIYEGWQTDAGGYLLSGFKDTEQELTQVTLLADPVVDDVYGCTDSAFFNFNPSATIDDGSCSNSGVGFN